MTKPLRKTFEQELSLLLEMSQKVDRISIGELLQILSGKSSSILLILLVLPFCLPIQIPGVSTPFGLMTMFVGFRMIFGKDLWLPKRLLTTTVSSKHLRMVARKGLVVINKMKRFITPRMVWIFYIPFIGIFDGILISVLGFLLALPLPIPFTNLAVAYPILILALALLEDDGALLIIGYVLSALAFGYFAFIFLSLNYLL